MWKIFFLILIVYMASAPGAHCEESGAKDVTKEDEEVPAGEEAEESLEEKEYLRPPKGKDRVGDPSTVPFRTLRRERRLRPRVSRSSARKSFDPSKVKINPDPELTVPPEPEENPPGVKTATGKDASEEKIVVAGPEYNQEQAPFVPSDLKPTLVENFDFHDVDIDDVVKAISKLTKKNFIIGQKLRGKVTIISPSAISIEDTWRAFLTALEINDLTTVESGAYIKIVRRTEARYSNIKTYSGDYSPDNDAIITRFINLKYIDANDIAETLRELISRAGGRIFAYDRTNTLIITDSGSNIKRLLKIINEMDVAGFEEKLDIVRVHYASASEIAEKIAVIIGSEEPDRRTRSTTRRKSTFRRKSSGVDGSSPLEIRAKIIPDDRINSLIVLATEANMRRLRRLLRKIDYATKTASTSNIHVHYLRNASAEEVVTTLTGITGDKGRGIGSTRGYTPGRSPGVRSSSSVVQGFSSTLFSGEVKINADKPTNSLVIIASQQDYEALKKIIAKLDIARKQVYVEAIIAEVTLSKAKTLGVSASQVDEKRGIFSFGDSSLNSLELLMNPMGLLQSGLAAGFASGEQKITVEGQEVSVGKMNLVMKALFANSDINVLSTPQILTMDNEEAEIMVGAKIPFLGNSSMGASGTTQQSVERQNVGIELKITPQINETSENVKLKIEQKANDISKEAVAGMPSGVGPATLERSAKTTVIVKDQEMVSIGGLMRDRISESITKVPILGDIPLIGWLFRNKSTEVRKTNLILFVKPTIISEYSDLRKLYHRKAEERRGFVTRAYGEEDIHQKFIDEQDKLKLDTKTK